MGTLKAAPGHTAQARCLLGHPTPGGIVATVPRRITRGSVSGFSFVVEYVELAGKLEHDADGPGRASDREARSARDGVIARAEEHAETARVEVRHAGKVDDHHLRL